jgi:hypothetical protein
MQLRTPSARLSPDGEFRRISGSRTARAGAAVLSVSASAAAEATLAALVRTLSFSNSLPAAQVTTLIASHPAPTVRQAATTRSKGCTAHALREVLNARSLCRAAVDTSWIRSV